MKYIINQKSKILFSIFIVSFFVTETLKTQESDYKNKIPLVPFYNIELIVFEHLNIAPQNEEIFDPVSSDTYKLEIQKKVIKPSPSKEKLLLQPRDTINIYDEPYINKLMTLNEIPTLEEFGLKLLDEADYKLTETYNKLERSKDYLPILHTAWVQPALERHTTKSLKLRRLGDPPLRLNGNIMLYLNRFLHLDINLSLEEKFPYRITEKNSLIPINNESQEMINLDRQFIKLPIFYRINEDQIVKNNELRYFDHPKFGALAKITLIQNEEEGLQENL